MVQAILVIHLLTALIIIGLIMMQQGKGAEAGASFGAGASQTIFGSSGSWNFFSRMTAIFATIFFVTSIALAIIAKESAVVEDPNLPKAEQVEIPDTSADLEIPSADNAAEIPVTDAVPVVPEQEEAVPAQPAEVIQQQGAAEPQSEAVDAEAAGSEAVQQEEPEVPVEVEPSTSDEAQDKE
jgi:preprotein translocase subunit SecG